MIENNALIDLSLNHFQTPVDQFQGRRTSVTTLVLSAPTWPSGHLSHWRPGASSQLSITHLKEEGALNLHPAWIVQFQEDITNSWSRSLDEFLTPSYPAWSIVILLSVYKKRQIHALLSEPGFFLNAWFGWSASLVKSLPVLVNLVDHGNHQSLCFTYFFFSSSFC